MLKCEGLWPPANLQPSPFCLNKPSWSADPYNSLPPSFVSEPYARTLRGPITVWFKRRWEKERSRAAAVMLIRQTHGWEPSVTVTIGRPTQGWRSALCSGKHNNSHTHRHIQLSDTTDARWWRRQPNVNDKGPLEFQWRMRTRPWCKNDPRLSDCDLS